MRSLFAIMRVRSLIRKCLYGKMYGPDQGHYHSPDHFPPHNLLQSSCPNGPCASVLVRTTGTHKPDLRSPSNSNWALRLTHHEHRGSKIVGLYSSISPSSKVSSTLHPPPTLTLQMVFLCYFLKFYQLWLVI